DGSTDSTLELLRKADDPVRVFTQSNKGPGAARNLGAEHASGDYLAFLDSDDLWFPWTLEIVAKIIRDHSDPAIISAKLVQFSDENELHGLQNLPVRVERFTDYFASSQRGYFVG